MARVSRKKQNLPTPAVDTPIRRWKTALYVRLSVEDNGKGSDSIENQTTLLEDYVASRSYLEKTALFVDNGYTGTDFLRPEFNRMMEAVKMGIVDCIVVKDLSVSAETISKHLSSLKRSARSSICALSPSMTPLILRR